MISTRAPLTLVFHASKVALLIDFENWCFSQFEAMQHLD
jgi:hypothetical protein